MNCIRRREEIEIEMEMERGGGGERWREGGKEKKEEREKREREGGTAECRMMGRKIEKELKSWSGVRRYVFSVCSTIPLWPGEIHADTCYNFSFKAQKEIKTLIAL